MSYLLAQTCDSSRLIYPFSVPKLTLIIRNEKKVWLLLFIPFPWHRSNLASCSISLLLCMQSGRVKSCGFICHNYKFKKKKISISTFCGRNLSNKLFMTHPNFSVWSLQKGMEESCIGDQSGEISCIYPIPPKMLLHHQLWFRADTNLGYVRDVSLLLQDVFTRCMERHGRLPLVKVKAGQAVDPSSYRKTMNGSFSAWYQGKM